MVFPTLNKFYTCIEYHDSGLFIQNIWYVAVNQFILIEPFVHLVYFLFLLHKKFLILVNQLPFIHPVMNKLQQGLNHMGQQSIQQIVYFVGSMWTVGVNY